ncbi:DUF397 domain-containing protein [Streptomyces sp. NPDC051561]|uniref:DUF397 domain-containing protein n=1 Tax=Streptomyces sp. NPDC051561 TaxID=3365658 RepID=UPI0037876654
MSKSLHWFKSSYSDSGGGQCIEVAYNWHKSSYSGGDGGECVEVATCPHTVHIRDTKLSGTGPIVAVPAPSWAAFLAWQEG